MISSPWSSLRIHSLLAMYPFSFLAYIYIHIYIYLSSQLGNSPFASRSPYLDEKSQEGVTNRLQIV